MRCYEVLTLLCWHLIYLGPFLGFSLGGYKKLAFWSSIYKTLFWVIYYSQVLGFATARCPGGWCCIFIDITVALLWALQYWRTFLNTERGTHPLAAPHADPLCSDKMTIFLEIQSMQNICLILCKSSGPEEKWTPIIKINMKYASNIRE